MIVNMDILLKCDLKYPDEIKEKTRYFPFAPLE